MSHSRPSGSLGGGGWESHQSPRPASSSGTNQSHSKAKEDKEDKVLADMYEMFLESIDPEIIESVVQSCKYNHTKSIETLLAMCGNENSSCPTQLPKKDKSGPNKNSKMFAIESPSTTMQDHGKKSRSSAEEAFPMQRSSVGSISTPAESAKSSFFPPVSSDPRKFPTSSTSFAAPSKSSSLPEAKKQDSYFMAMSNIRWYIQNEMKIMILMRGCPGSGKSFLAKQLIDEFSGKPKDYIFSTDEYFIRNNRYNFEPTRLGEAHEWNQKRVLSKMRDGKSPIIIDNTNTELWEMQVYASLAISNGYVIEILEPQTAWFKKVNELFKRNEHGVPQNKIKQMLERYQFNIKVVDLIKSTGAKYSKSPPQPADQPLRRTMDFNSCEPARLQHFNSYGVRRNVAMSNIMSSTSSHSSDTSHVNMDTAHGAARGHFLKFSESPRINGFYFGSNVAGGSFDSYEAITNKVQSYVEQTSPKKLTEVGNSAFSCPTSFFNVEDGNSKPSLAGSCSENIPPHSSESIELLNALVDDSKSFPSDSCFSQNNVAESNTSTSESLFEDLKIIDGRKMLAQAGSADENTTRSNSDPSEDQNNGFSSESVIISAPNLAHSIKEENVDSIRELEQLSLSEEKEKRSHALEESCSEGIVETVLNDSHAIPTSVSGQELSDSWAMTGEWDQDKNASKNELVNENCFPKPQRSFNLKSIDDYCKSVKDMDDELQSEASGWSFCDNSSATWQPIDKIQEELRLKEQLCSPQRISNYLQRAKFNRLEVSDKDTNTNHADFLILNNLTCNNSIEGITVLNAYDRDINHGTTVSEAKIPVKLMLDKGTLTEDDFCGDLKTENKQDKVKELSRLFPNRSPASLKELLKQCNGDVNYVSNLLLDDNGSDEIVATYPGDTVYDSDSDLEPANLEIIKSAAEPKDQSMANEPLPAPTDKIPVVCTQDEAEEVKRHIEQSIDFSENSYSPHLLSIKNFRRGLREGAIPKVSSPVLEESISCPPEPSAAPEDNGSSDDDFNDELQFVISQDFIQQLVDKFGGPYKVADVSPVVKLPLSLARQIYDIIFSGSDQDEDEEDDDDDDGDGYLAIKLQCEEDERMARELYEEMLDKKGEAVPSVPRLQEIMDMELAQSIYKADLDSLTQNSQETMATVLAKRLLEDNFSKVDKRVLHEIFASCNNSFEDTVKTLQESLSDDSKVFSESGRAQREQALLDRAKRASLQGYQSAPDKSSDIRSQSSPQEYYENTDDLENPWEVSDPMAAHNRYREEADKFLKERDEMYSKATDAFNRKQRSVAAYYAQLGQLNNKKYHHTRALAVAALAAAHTGSHSLDTLDLHHFRVIEAVTVFDMFLDYHIRVVSEQGSGHSCLKIITGRGQHSVNGKPRIKPAIISRIRKRGLRYDELKNPGVVRVWIKANSPLSQSIPD